MTTLFINISLLVNVREESVLLRGAGFAHLPIIEDAYLLIEDDLIAAYGSMAMMEVELESLPTDLRDMTGRIIMPCWCDSHTHLVFAGTRENEFIDKLKGKTYAEIAASGGGILNSAKKLNDTPENVLFDMAMKRLKDVQRSGTGCIEIKSGYGLSVEGELKMLRVIKRMKQESHMTIKSTFLGAHSFPQEYKQDHKGYLDLIINEMLPSISEEGLADYIDVFCENGFFSADETDLICKAGMQYGLIPKLHVNQMSSCGGIEIGIANDALSLDHLETLTDNEISMLGSFKGCSTLLPTAAFFLRMQYQPARALIESGAAVTLASDYNPGSSPSGNMNFVAALSCIQMKMLPEEVINAGTINGAFAIGEEKHAGSITIGKDANIIITKKIPSLAYLFYSFGTDNIDAVMIKGRWVDQEKSEL